MLDKLINKIEKIATIVEKVVEELNNTELEGKTIPELVFKTRIRDETIEGPNPYKWYNLSTDEIFKDKKVILFSLPGAFTPTCSSTHLPGFEENYDKFKELGIDEVYCTSVNDAFCMFQWSKNLNVNKVKMLPDGNGDLTEELGMMVEKRNLGFGKRSWRYAIIVDNGIITKSFIEPGKSDNCEEDPFTCTDWETVYNYLKK